MSTGLHRFWITFNPTNRPPTWGLGCGVTAYDYEDAIAILRQTVFAKCELPEVVDVIADVDVTTLDPGHVLPNMDPVVWRGVWFPKGLPTPRA